MEDLENRVGVSHSPLIGEHRRGGGEGRCIIFSH